MSTRILRFLLPLLLLLGSCRGSQPQLDVALRTTPETAANAAGIVEALHLTLPVEVRDQDGMLDMQGLYGATYYPDGYYLVLLESSLEPHAKVMVLLHELAHVLAREQGVLSLGHGPEWGLAYAEVFRVMIQENP